MHVVIFIFLLVFSSFSMAQMPANVQEAVDCMGSLEQSAMEEMGKRGEEVGNQIEALCDKGDESAAREVALTYVKEMTESDAMEEMRRCSEMMREAMPGMQTPEIPCTETLEREAENICENIGKTESQTP